MYVTFEIILVKGLLNKPHNIPCVNKECYNTVYSYVKNPNSLEFINILCFFKSINKFFVEPAVTYHMVLDNL